MTIGQIQNELTEKEISLFKSLVKLGDDEKTAFDTVIKEREKPDNKEFYRFAYEN